MEWMKGCEGRNGGWYLGRQLGRPCDRVVESVEDVDSYMRDSFLSKSTVNLEVLAIVGVCPVDDFGVVVATEARL